MTYNLTSSLSQSYLSENVVIKTKLTKHKINKNLNKHADKYKSDKQKDGRKERKILTREGEKKMFITFPHCNNIRLLPYPFPHMTLL